ncbi:unnamed protein product [Pylaiella littoralis]
MPRGIRVLVEEEQAKIDNPSDEDRLDAVKVVARKTATSMKWHIKVRCNQAQTRQEMGRQEN